MANWVIRVDEVNGDWELRFSGKRPIRTWNAITDYLNERDWTIVAAVADTTDAEVRGNGTGLSYLQVRTYRLFLTRPES